jgi:hypothetical protein
MKRSANCYLEVLLTYFSRPMFWGLAMWTVLVPLFILVMHQFRINPFNPLSPRNDIDNLVRFSCLMLPAGWGATLIFHAREQLQNWRSILMPGYRAPQLIVTATIFAFLSAILSVEYYFGLDGDYFIYSLLAALTIMIISGWIASFKLQRGTIVLALVLLISIMALPILFSCFSLTFPYYGLILNILIYDVLPLSTELLLLGIVLFVLIWGLLRKLALMGRPGELFFIGNVNLRVFLGKTIESIKESLLAYLCHPLFRNLWVWSTIFIFCFITLDHLFDELSYRAYFWVYYWYPQDPRGYWHYQHQTWGMFLSDLISAVSFCFMMFLPAAWGAFWTTHFREQLQSLRYALAPHYRLAQLTGAGLTYVITALLLSVFYFYFASASFIGPLCNFMPFQFYDYSPTGTLLVFIFTTMTISACWAYFQSRWLATLFGMLTASIPILVAYYHYFVFYPMEFDINIYDYDSIRIYTLQNPVITEYLSLGCLVSLVLLGFLLAMDPRRNKAILKELKNASANRKAPSTWPVDKLWLRLQHRRASILGSRLTWQIAGAAAAVLTFLTMRFHPFYFRESLTGEMDYLIIDMCCIITIITPAIIAALSWYFRQPALITEYFHPMSRQMFLREMSTALACDLVELWLAIATIAILPLAVSMPSILLNPIFWLGLAATFLALVLAFGVIVWTMSFRFWAFVILGLVVAISWEISPLINDLTKITPAGAQQTFIFSLIAAPVGMVLTLAAYYRWQRIELA